MKIKEVTYGRTYSKNYQSLRVEVTIELDTAAGESHNAGLDLAKAIVDQRIEKEKDGI